MRRYAIADVLHDEHKRRSAANKRAQVAIVEDVAHAFANALGIGDDAPAYMRFMAHVTNGHDDDSNGNGEANA